MERVRGRISAVRRSSDLVWLDDGEHFLQRKDGRLHKVEALTGRSQPFLDADKLARALAALPTIDKRRPRALARSQRLAFEPAAHRGICSTHENDLYLLPSRRRQGRRV